MLSVHNPNAEEALDAGIIKSASRPAHPRRRGTGRRNYQIRVQTYRIGVSTTFSLMSLLGCEKKGVIHLNPFHHHNRQKLRRVTPFLSHSQMSKCLDSSARFVKQNARIKSASCKLSPRLNPSQIENVLSEESEAQDSKARGSKPAPRLSTQRLRLGIKHDLKFAC